MNLLVKALQALDIYTVMILNFHTGKLVATFGEVLHFKRWMDFLLNHQRKRFVIVKLIEVIDIFSINVRAVPFLIGKIIWQQTELRL